MDDLEATFSMVVTAPRGTVGSAFPGVWWLPSQLPQELESNKQQQSSIFGVGIFRVRGAHSLLQAGFRATSAGTAQPFPWESSFESLGATKR